MALNLLSDAIRLTISSVKPASVAEIVETLHAARELLEDAPLKDSLAQS